jgi:Protein of unknown function (DUF2889)
MPLSKPSARHFITRRTIICEGYSREDGLLDVEGRLVDVRGFDMPRDWRDEVRAGQPIHDMSVRLSVDDNLLIHAVESVTDASPFPTCTEVTPNMQRLVGLTIGGGFKKRMQQLVGSTEGCTHIMTLLETLLGVAVHAVSGKHREKGMVEFWSNWGQRGSSPPALIGSCHSYAADSSNVQRLFPLHYKPRQ